jgi:hypothetical protein
MKKNLEACKIVMACHDKNVIHDLFKKKEK